MRPEEERTRIVRLGEKETEPRDYLLSYDLEDYGSWTMTKTVPLGGWR